MLKKIIGITLLVGFSGVLIWGGVNRTLARTSERNASSTEPNSRGTGGKGVEASLNSYQEDREQPQHKFQNQDILGSRGNNESGNQGFNADSTEERGQEKELRGSGQGRGSSSDQGEGNSSNQEGGSGSGQGEGSGSGQVGGRGNGQGGSSGSGQGGGNSSAHAGGSGYGQSSGNDSGQGSSNDYLDESEIEALHSAIDDEYHALAVYQAVIADFGEVSPFTDLAQAENQHIEALLKQFEKHGLTPPENMWLGNVPGFDSIQAACQAGAEAELANVALYDQLFSMIDDPGLIQVFANLSRASLESHLPAFQSCQ